MSAIQNLKHDSALIAVQREAAEQAEENWESLKAAEKRIFEDIAKGAPPPLPLCIFKRSGPQVAALLRPAMKRSRCSLSQAGPTVQTRLKRLQCSHAQAAQAWGRSHHRWLA